MEAKGEIRLHIESCLENVSLIGSAVRGIAEMLSIDSVGQYHLELCVVEAVTNVIKHAYHSKAGHGVDLQIQVYPDRLTFKLQDSGEHMDISRVAPLRFDPSNLETLPERGMGIFILRNLMDEIDYKVVNGQNVLTLCQYLKIKDHGKKKIDKEDFYGK